MKKYSSLILIFMGLFFLFPAARAADSPSDTDTGKKIEELDTLLQTSKNLSRMISATREVLQGPQGQGREKELQAKIDELTARLKETENSIDQLSAGVDMGVFQQGVKRDVDWSTELREMLEPLIREMKKMTSRPREIERLRDEIERYDLQLASGGEGQQKPVTAHLPYHRSPTYGKTERYCEKLAKSWGRDPDPASHCIRSAGENFGGEKIAFPIV